MNFFPWDYGISLFYMIDLIVKTMFLNSISIKS